MNDRFRFRAWNRETKQYHYGAENTYDYMYGLPSVMKCSFGSLLEDTGEGNRYVLEQCTGLKDKNGRLIYEGDIVKRISKHDEEEPIVLLQVEWNNKGGRYVTTDKKHSTWTFSMFEYFYEVVGNIHENPELLEDK